MTMARNWLKGLAIATASVAVLPVAGGLLHAATRTAPCDRTELTASIGNVQSSPPHGSALDRMTIVLVGDAGFNPTDAKVEAGGIRKGKKLTSFPDTLAGISGKVDGDLAFINIETVVTDRNDLAPEGKGKGAFHFRSHPAALTALIDAGFNLFSLANNHSYDYGPQGIEETLYHFAVANAREGDRLCRHRQQFRRGDPSRLHRPRRHAHRLLGDRHHDRRPAAISRRSEQAGAGLLSRSPRLRGDRG